MSANQNQAPIATFLPLTSLKNYSAQLDFLRWLKKNHQSGWLMTPISDPIKLPYKNYGIGYSNIFLEKNNPQIIHTLDRQEFFSANKYWLSDYALHQAISQHYGTDQWWRWPEKIHHRQPQALETISLKLQEKIGYFMEEQYQLANQFMSLRADAQARNITLIGDLPFYLAQESPLVWTKQDLFLIRKNGDLPFQSGVPAHPDEPFAAQVWGHPLYDWRGQSLMQIIRIFLDRLTFLNNFFDLVRIDHAAGFFNYGITYPDKPHWNKKVPGPGKKALDLLLNHAQTIQLGLFFEDIGSETLALRQYLKKNNLIGMQVLTLAYNHDGQANLDHNDQKFLQQTGKNFMLDQYKGNHVIFSSTHDTLPPLAWYQKLPPALQALFLQVNQLPSDLNHLEILAAIRNKIISQSASLIIIPWQDWQGEKFRYNTPGRENLSHWNKKIKIENYL